MFKLIFEKDGRAIWVKLVNKNGDVMQYGVGSTKEKALADFNVQ